MLLGASEAGQRYRIYTLSEASDRVKVFQDLGVEALSLQLIADTTLEEIYEQDDHNNHVYEILTSILTSVPEGECSSTELLARAKLVEGLQKQTAEKSSKAELESYIDTVPDPLPEDDRSADELLDETESRGYGDPELVPLYEAALHRDHSVGTLFDYLYFSGRDIVERYRHFTREEPSVAELELAKRQFALLNRADLDLGQTRAEYVQSYAHVVQGVLDSGREWRSEQDPYRIKEADFHRAAQAYLKAAVPIAESNPERYLKYCSKAFRHSANATDSWEAKKDIHESAVAFLIRQGQAKDVDSDVVDTTKDRHLLWKQIAQTYAELVRNDFGSAHTSADQALDRLDDIEIRSSDKFKIDRAQLIAGGRIVEADGDYDGAVEFYDRFDKSDRAVKARLVIAEIKSHIQDGSPSEALELSQANFGEDSLLTISIQALVDGEVSLHSSSESLPEELFRETSALEEQLYHLLSLYVSAEEFDSELRNLIKLALLNL